MPEASILVRFAETNRVYTNGDKISGTVTLTCFGNLTLRAIEVYCRCTVVAYATIGDHTQFVEHQHLFQRHRKLFPESQRSAARNVEKLTLRPGIYTFPFEFTLPESEVDLPQSFNQENDMSGVFWHVRARVERCSKLQKPIVGQLNFAFIPSSVRSLNVPTREVVKQQKFVLSVCEPRLTIPEFLAKKKNLPVEVTCRVTYPASGLALGHYTESFIGLWLSSNIEHAIFIDRISVCVQEHTKVYCLSSQVKSEKPIITHPLVVLTPHMLITKKGIDLGWLLGASRISNITVGTIQLPHLHHDFSLSISLVFSSATSPRRQQVVTFVSEMFVQSRTISRASSVAGSSLTLVC